MADRHISTTFNLLHAFQENFPNFPNFRPSHCHNGIVNRPISPDIRLGCGRIVNRPIRPGLSDGMIESSRTLSGYLG